MQEIRSLYLWIISIISIISNIHMYYILVVNNFRHNLIDCQTKIKQRYAKFRTLQISGREEIAIKNSLVIVIFCVLYAYKIKVNANILK